MTTPQEHREQAPAKPAAGHGSTATQRPTTLDHPAGTTGPSDNRNPPRRGAHALAGRSDGDQPWLTPRRLGALVLVLITSYAALTVIRALRTVLVMIAVSLFLSFAMEPAVQWLARRGIQRTIATAIVFVLCLLLAVGGVALIPPRSAASSAPMTAMA